MKKIYEAPEVGIVEVELQPLLNFSKSETMDDFGIGSGTVDPGKAKSRGFSLWEDEDL